MIAIMEQSDIPFGAHMVQETGQCAGTLRKFKADQAFAGNFFRPSPDHVTNMDFGDFVIGQVNIRQSCVSQLFTDDGQVLRTCSLQADKNMSIVVVAVAVVELGNIPTTQYIDKLEEAAFFFRNGNSKNTFVTLAQLTAF